MINKYIYILKIVPMLDDISNEFIYRHSIYGEIFKEFDKAIEYGIKILKEIVEDYLETCIEEIDQSDIDFIYSTRPYIFTIRKYAIDCLDFNSTDDLLRYYDENINKISNFENKYDFIMSLISYEDLHFDHIGKLINTNINNKYDDCSIRFTSKSFHFNYTLDKFKDGDFVIRKYENDEIVLQVKRNDENNLTIRNYPGYYLINPITETIVNDLPDHLYFDQDLIGVDICPNCYAAITDDFKIQYENSKNRCPRCLNKIKSLEEG